MSLTRNHLPAACLRESPPRKMKLIDGFLLSLSFLLVLNFLPLTTTALAATSVVAWGDNTYGQTNVPPGLTNVVAVASGPYHSLALRSDGTLVAWGRSLYGEANVPSGLTNVTAIAAGDFYSVAVKTDGTVVGWGGFYALQTNVPANLSNAIAVAAGASSVALKADGTMVSWGSISTLPPAFAKVVAIAQGAYHGLGLKADGTVQGWGERDYGATSIPSGLVDAVGLAAGAGFSLALRADGTVAAWGRGDRGQTNVPPDLTNAVALAAGSTHGLALKADGTLAAWGQSTDAYGNDSGATNVPPDLTNVVAVAAGELHSLALVGDCPPLLTPPRADHVSPCGTRVRFSVCVTGTRPLTYQWQFHGTNLPGATNLTLSLETVSPNRTGCYSVTVSNAFGVATSACVSLSLGQIAGWGGAQGFVFGLSAGPHQHGSGGGRPISQSGVRG
jgi:hypothetical protein